MIESKVAANSSSPRISRDDLEAFFARTASLRGVHQRLPSPDCAEPASPELLREALQQLQVVHQQLAIAEEELMVQNEQLVAANRVLDLERERYRDLFDRAPDPHIITDRMGVIHEANRAAIALLGNDFSQIRGKPIAVFVEREHVGKLRDAVTEVVRGGPAEVRLKLGNRKQDYSMVQLRGALTGNPHAILWVAAVTSATTTGIFDSVSPKQRRDSKTPPSIPIIELAEEEAPVSQGQRALAVLSHELREPLNAVLVWASLLRRGQLDEKGRDRAVSIIERNTLMQAAIIDGLVDVSRLTTHGLELQESVVDLSNAVALTLEAARPAAEQMGVCLHVEIEAGVTVWGDETRITQIAMNLLSNALKFTPPQGYVTARVRRRGRHAVFSVSDTGCGIEADALAKIFECFEQGGSAMAKAGMGLGLFLVRELVHLHGGTVEALSEGPGLGATFVVLLPLYEIADGSPP